MQADEITESLIAQIVAGDKRVHQELERHLLSIGISRHREKGVCCYRNYHNGSYALIKDSTIRIFGKGFNKQFAEGDRTSMVLPYSFHIIIKQIHGRKISLCPTENSYSLYIVPIADFIKANTSK